MNYGILYAVIFIFCVDLIFGVDQYTGTVLMFTLTKIIIHGNRPRVREKNGETPTEYRQAARSKYGIVIVK